MLDDLIQNAAKLMEEQAAAYGRLDAACRQLVEALVDGKPEEIESLTRAGEGELLKMRVRLGQLMTALTAFADRRAEGDGEPALTPETRIAFRKASSELLRAAQEYQQIQARSTAVATNGASLATVGIQLRGVEPITYRAPYTRRGEGKTWG
jgi:hypothetical protein